MRIKKIEEFVDGPGESALDVSKIPIVRWLAIIAFVLVAIGISSQAYLYAATPATGLRLIRLFDLDQENNIPSYFSAILLFLAFLFTAIVAFVKARRKDRFRFHWATLGILVLGASVDEAASIHEILTETTRELLGADGVGYLYFAWVVPGMIFVTLAAILFSRFVYHLPGPIRSQMVTAGIVFLGGAVGVEMLGGEHFELWGPRNFTFAAYCAAEESMEMAGVLLYIRAILAQLRMSGENIRLRFGDSSTSS
ncbi:MAG: hypothetical protein FJW38_04315 [Acidobacteria bacterium]|nr:hypothetical protein [Acidobacteriota bacterium]